MPHIITEKSDYISTFTRSFQRAFHTGNPAVWAGKIAQSAHHVYRVISAKGNTMYTIQGRHLHYARAHRRTRIHIWAAGLWLIISGPTDLSCSSRERESLRNSPLGRHILKTGFSNLDLRWSVRESLGFWRISIQHIRRDKHKRPSRQKHRQYVNARRRRATEWCQCYMLIGCSSTMENPFDIVCVCVCLLTTRQVHCVRVPRFEGRPFAVLWGFVGRSVRNGRRRDRVKTIIPPAAWFIVFGSIVRSGAYVPLRTDCIVGSHKYVNKKCEQKHLHSTANMH